MGGIYVELLWEVAFIKFSHVNKNNWTTKLYNNSNSDHLKSLRLILRIYILSLGGKPFGSEASTKMFFTSHALWIILIKRCCWGVFFSYPYQATWICYQNVWRRLPYERSILARVKSTCFKQVSRAKPLYTLSLKNIKWTD